MNWILHIFEYYIFLWIIFDTVIRAIIWTTIRAIIWSHYVRMDYQANRYSDHYSDHTVSPSFVHNLSRTKFEI